MLAPKRVKHRKMHRGRMKGKAKGHTEILYGDYAIVAMEPGWITNRQIEASRVAMTRHIKRGGKVWITIFPDKPVTKKPAHTRIGSGKDKPRRDPHGLGQGQPRGLGRGRAPRPGDVRARRCGRAARARSHAPRAAQAADQDQVHHAGGWLSMASKAAELRELPDEELYVRIESAKEELFNLRFQLATGQLDTSSRLKELRHDVARTLTVLRERHLEVELEAELARVDAET